jgi:hypothetical protein
MVLLININIPDVISIIPKNKLVYNNLSFSILIVSRDGSLGNMVSDLFIIL